MADADPAMCPKCGAPRSTDPAVTACPRCGLGVAKMEDYARDRDARVAAPVQAAWERVAAAWDDPALHDELFRLTTLHTCHAWTAARYRTEWLARGGTGLDPHLERMRKAAEATLLTTATARPEAATPYRSARLTLIALVVLLVIGAVAAVVLGGQARSNAPGGRPSTIRQPPPPAEVR